MWHFPSNPKAKVKHDLDICEIKTRLCFAHCQGTELLRESVMPKICFATLNFIL